MQHGKYSTALSTSRARLHLFFASYHDTLTAKYLCICTLPDDKVDEEGVWSDGPLLNDLGHRAAVLGMIWSRVEEVLPFLLGTANSLGLTVFDWGGPTIYRPESAPRPS